MASYRRVRIPLAALGAALLSGCTGVMLAQPTPGPGQGPLGVPQPTVTQIAVGANPTRSAPQINQFVAQVPPPGERGSGNPYGWLESVRSRRTRHWMALQNRRATKALASLPRRAWILSRLEQLQGGGGAGAALDVVVKRVGYLGADGTSLPMEIAYRRGLARDGNQPTLLSVYHVTGKPPAPLLQPFVLVWLQMGGLYARAEVRNALARVPPPRGVVRMPDRSIALSDLFAAAQSLIERRFTRRARLGIYGRGFGGLMAGAAAALRPDFFGVALPTGTWAQYRRITTGNCFPPTLIITAEHDGTVKPWQGYELAAVLQAEQICAHPILIRIESDAGPEEPSTLRQERAADELVFAARWLEVPLPANPL
jgi:prolyl oligopeptidase PreP (S9A serine peptidase family)